MATKSAISFGMVHIPVSLHPATTDNDIHFNQLHKEDNARIKYKKVCSSCGKELESSEIAKGYEYEKGRYVIVTDDDMEKIKTEKDKTMQIMHFSELSEINPIYLDKSYHAIPEAGGEKAFELLKTAMLEEGKVALAKTVMGSKEKILALIARQDGIVCQTLFYQDEIKAHPKPSTGPAVGVQELNMAKMLISSMIQEFDPREHANMYQEKLKDLIADKISGKETKEPVAKDSGNVIDLMEALTQSLTALDPPKKAKAV
ncbi:MAG: Ku protein [Clostridiales bacterium]|nr:Ku protein [Clostridiales bacterium]